MGDIPHYNNSSTRNRANRSGLTAKPENPLLARVLEERRNHLGRLSPFGQHKAVKEIIRDARVIIVEGIAGSGKDTFQTHLKKMLERRDVYDYSEGEVLNSWKQMQIAGIFELRIKFMKLFVNYVRDIVSRDENATFLLNRFHLSAYVFTILQKPELETQYYEIINVLRSLPVHVFLLQLNETEIGKRSSHPERSGAWRKFQQQIAKEDGFRDRLERYIRQQRLMLELAEKHQIPFSVMKLPSSFELEGAHVRVSETPSNFSRAARIKSIDAKPSQRKRGLPPIF